MNAMRRDGFTVLETLVALLLSSLLLGGVTAVLSGLQRRIDRELRALEYRETVRVALDRLDRAMETGGVDPVGGPRIAPDGGLVHRAFRGSAVWCGDGWRESAVRNPDPTRDSVLWIDGSGRIRVAALVARSAGGCGGEGYLWRIAVPPDSTGRPAEAGVLRWFETGRIRIDDAVRYGRSDAPAQPLTAANLAGASGVRVTGGVVEVTLEGAEADAGPPVVRRWRPPPPELPDR